jgi:lysophospholipase L1-like esterase
MSACPPFPRARHVLLAAAAALLPYLLPATPAAAEGACPPTPPVALHVPHLRAALARGDEGVIVALGSSSTEGAMASDPAHTYPAVLQAALSDGLPTAHFAVLNRGIGGQDAPEEFARLEDDVIAIRPQLVIWQVGANGAMRNADPQEFARLVTTGVRRLKAAKIDVVLMDNQRCPRVDATPAGVLLDDVLGRVADETGANLFSRAALMEAWEREGTPMRQFISTDGLHHNDRGYACVASALARDLLVALGSTRQLSASR